MEDLLFLLEIDPRGLLIKLLDVLSLKNPHLPKEEILTHAETLCGNELKDYIKNIVFLYQ